MTSTSRSSRPRVPTTGILRSEQQLLPVTSPLNNGPSTTSEVELNLDHIELLIHLSLEKDMFNLGFGIEEYRPSELMLAMTRSLKSPMLIHQLLAFSSRHLAYIHPERFAFYDHQAVALQTMAISLFHDTYTAAGVDQSNCAIVLLFAADLSHHTLADALAVRTLEGICAFVQHYTQCVETHRGIYTIATTAWPMLMESELEFILAQSTAFTSRQPKGHHCQSAKQMVNESCELNIAEKKACLSALRYLQVGLDAVTAQDEENHRYQMICTWPMLLTPEFSRLLSSMRPEALVVFAYYAELLHFGKTSWQVGDSGMYVFELVANHLDTSWSRWLEPPKQAIFAIQITI